MRYFRDTSISISRIYSGYLDTDTMRYIAWYRYHIICKYTPKQVDFQTKWRVFVRVKIKAWSKSVSIQTDRRKRLAACTLRIVLVGCMSVNQLDSKWRQRRNLFLNIFFLTIKTKASTVVAKGEEWVPCDPGYELRKGGSLAKSWAENTRGWDRRKEIASMNECISCTCWCVYWSVGCGTSQ